MRIPVFESYKPVSCFLNRTRKYYNACGKRLDRQRPTTNAATVLVVLRKCVWWGGGE